MSPKCPLSVIICTCERYGLVGEAIESVLRQDYPALELIVVDNSADAADARAFAAHHAGREKIRFVYEPIQGLSQARNTGIEAAQGDIVAFMDDDAIAEPGWAKNLVATFHAFPNTGCVGGRILPRWLAPRPNWLDDGSLGYLSIVDWGDTPREMKSGEWVAGCNIAYDRTLLRDVGGFPTSLGRKGIGSSLLSNDESTVNHHIKLRGRAIMYAPSAIVQHQIPAERLTKKWFLRRAAWQGVSDFVAFSSKPNKLDQAITLLSKLKQRMLPYWPVNGSLQSHLTEIYNTVLDRLNREPELIENLDAQGGNFLNASLKMRL
jgi:glycosyltransferase involved in cell wall biosynthesis